MIHVNKFSTTGVRSGPKTLSTPHDEEIQFVSHTWTRWDATPQVNTATNYNWTFLKIKAGSFVRYILISVKLPLL